MLNGVVISEGSAITRVVGISLFAIIFLWTINKNLHSQKFAIIYVYIVYLALSILFLSSNYMASYRMLAKYSGALLCLPLAFNLTSGMRDIIKINKYFIVFTILFIFNFCIANILKLGGSRYGTIGVDTGSLFDDALYTNVLALIMLPLLLSVISKHKNILIILYLLNVAITVVCFKRTVIAGLIACILFFIAAYAYYNVRYIKYRISKRIFSKQQILLSVIAIVSLSVAFSDLFLLQTQAREKRMEAGLDITNEGRFVELKMISYDILYNNSNWVKLFGKETFNTVGTYSLSVSGSIDERMIHDNYGIILNGGGIFGLVFHLVILFFPLVLFRKYTRGIILNNLQDRLLYIAFLSIFLLSVIASFSGTLWITLYPSLCYTLEGAILRYFYNLGRKKQADVKEVEAYYGR